MQNIQIFIQFIHARAYKYKLRKQKNRGLFKIGFAVGQKRFAEFDVLQGVLQQGVIGVFQRDIVIGNPMGIEFFNTIELVDFWVGYANPNPKRAVGKRTREFRTLCEYFCSRLL